MNTRAFTLALVIAIFSMVMVHTYVEDQRSEIIATFGTDTAVVVAKQDIQELELIDDSKVTQITVPAKFLAPGHFKTVKEIENTIATVPILKDEQITKPRVTFPGSKTGLSRQVSAGKRAVAIPITENQAVSKLLKPGDRVDIIASVDYTSGSRKDIQSVKTILQDVLVLSTGYNMTNSIPLMGIKTPTAIKAMNANVYESYNTVTLELGPYEVQKLVFVLSYTNSRPYLALRNNNDKQPVRIKPTNIYDMLGEDTEEAKAFFQDKYSGAKRGK